MINPGAVAYFHKPSEFQVATQVTTREELVLSLDDCASKAVEIRAMVSKEIPLLAALSNDHGYECVFERPIELWADVEEVLLAFSSSGQSPDILRAVRASAVRECRTVTFSGVLPANPLRRMGKVNFYVSSQAYGYVEVFHTALTHFLTDCCMAAPLKERKANG